MKGLLSLIAFLTVFSVSVFAAPAITVTPTSIQNDSLNPIQLDVSTFTGPDIIFRLYVDVDGDGIIDPEDYVLYTHIVEDNYAELSPNVFDDQNPTAGQIRINPKFFTFAHIPYSAGSYIWEVEDTFDSSTGTNTFTITQDILLPQTVSGTVYDETMTPVPGAGVGLFPYGDCGSSGPFTTADINGEFTLYLPTTVECKNKLLIAVMPGYYSSYTDAPMVYLDGGANIVQDLSITAGTHSVSGYVKYADGADVGFGITGQWIQGWLEESGWFSFAVTDEDGYYELFLPDGLWYIGIDDEIGMSYEGAVLDGSQWQGANVSGAPVVVPDINHPVADYFISGVLRDETSALLFPGMKLDSNDSTVLSTATISDSPSGAYTIGVKGGDWYNSLRDDSPAGYTVQGNLHLAVSGDISGQDIIFYNEDYTISGTVTDRLGNPVSDICIEANSGNYSSSAYSDCNGQFSLSVINGTWNVEVVTEGISRLGYDELAKSKTVVVNNGNISSIHFVLIDHLAMPFIYFVDSSQTNEGEMVNIYGRNLGSAPVAYFNGTPAITEDYNVGQGILTVTVPVGSTSGPLIVNNNDTGIDSNSISFTVLAGTITPTCTISGNLTDNTSAPLSGVRVYVYNADNGRFVRETTSDGSGNYSVSTVSGNYRIWFQPPAPYVSYWYEPASCPEVVNYQFVTGSEIFGTVVNENMDTVPNALVEADNTVNSYRTVADSNGDYSIIVPDGTYNLLLEGPFGSRYIAQKQTGITVAGGSVDNGQTVLQTGWLISGSAQYKDGENKGALAGVDIDVYDSSDIWQGLGLTRADGNFEIAVPEGQNFRLYVWGEHNGYLNLDVKSVDVKSDVILDYRLQVFSNAPQFTTAPAIYEANPAFQENQRVAFDCINVEGTAVDVKFSDSTGGWIDGINTGVDGTRGSVITTVPTGATTGSIKLVVDGVESDEYPVRIDSGVFSPGTEILSGTVYDNLSAPLPNTLVALEIQVCDDVFIWDYSITDGNGNYSLNHNTGDYGLIVLPPVSSGQVSTFSILPGLPGGTTNHDITLSDGNEVTFHFVDSGTGPTGNTGADIPVTIGNVEGTSIDFEDWMLGDSGGIMRFFVDSGEYYFEAKGPFRSRYLEVSTTQTISSDLNFGDVSTDSGYFIDGRIIDSSGKGFAGVEVYAQDSTTWDQVSSTMSVKTSGSFRLPVPAGTYHLSFYVPDDFDYYISPIQNIVVNGDTLIYPAVTTQETGHISGTVYDSNMSPLGDIWVQANDYSTGQYVTGSSSCADGTYSIRVPSGNYNVQVAPWDEPCLPMKYYNDTYYSCEAEMISIAFPSDDITGIDFTVEPAGTISGTVLDDTLTPVGGVQVCVDEGPTSPSCSISCNWTDSSGNYVLEHIPTGSSYRISADGIPQGLTYECYDNFISCASYNPVTVTECNNTPNIDFSLTIPSGAPGSVPDGYNVPGSQMTVSSDGLFINVLWQNTCDADSHVIYFGSLGAFDSYTSAICDAGADGQEDFPIPAGNVFWVIGGTAGGTTEGPYGYRTTGESRPSDSGLNCGFVQDLNGGCIP